MAEQSFFGKTAQKLTHDVVQASLSVGKFTTRKVADAATVAKVGSATTLRSLMAHGPGIAASMAIDGYINYRDYKFEESRQRAFYETEIAATLGKRPESVTVKDMKDVAETNPVIAEGIERNKKTFRMNFGVNALSGILAVAAAVTVIGALGVGGIAAFGVAMAVGLPIFIGSEKLLEKAGKKVFGLAEPSITDVSKDVSLQHTLSVPSQMEFLERQQDHRRPITQEQVMTLFAAAKPELASEIESRFGTKFNDMMPQMKDVALAQIGPRYNLEQVTEGLNHRTVRVQELAFIANGQASGVPPLEAPHVSRMEKAHAQMHEKYTQMQHKIDSLGAQLKSQAAHMSDVVKHKLGFAKSDVSGTVLGSEMPAQQAAPEPEKIWTATVPQPAVPGGTRAEQILAQRTMPRGAIAVGAS